MGAVEASTVPSSSRESPATDFPCLGMENQLTNRGVASAIEGPDQGIVTPEDHGSPSSGILSELDERIFQSMDILEDEDGKDDYEPESKKRKRVGHCKCASEVTHAWKTDVDATKSYDMTKNLRLLRMWKEGGYICYAHTKMMGSHMGL